MQQSKAGVEAKNGRRGVALLNPQVLLAPELSQTQGSTEESAANTQVDAVKPSVGCVHRVQDSAPMIHIHRKADAERCLSSVHHLPRNFMFAVGLAVSNLQNERRLNSSATCSLADLRPPASEQLASAECLRLQSIHPDPTEVRITSLQNVRLSPGAWR